MDQTSRLKKRIEELEKTVLQLQRPAQAIEAAGFDIWENNFVTGETFGTNRNIFESIGYSPEEIPQTLDELYTFIHPDDLTSARQAISEHFAGNTPRYQAEMRVRAKDGSWRWVGNYGRVEERNEAGEVTKFIGVNFDIDKRRIVEEELIQQNRKLREAMEHIKALQGIIPICSSCKKIRDDKGYWNQIELYLQKHSMAEFSHGICPDCASKLYPDFNIPQHKK